MTSREGTTRVVRLRAGLAATAVVLIALDLGVKAWANRGLADGSVIDLHVIQLRLAFNSGVAFSFGGALPSWVIVTVTGLITAGLALYAWRVAARSSRMLSFALAAVFAGAAANVIDRASDGVVTDYLHTGWFPTFNLADVFITLGGVALVLASMREPGADKA